MGEPSQPKLKVEGPLRVERRPWAWHVSRMSKARRTAAEVAKYLRDFIDGVGGDWDWDDFESVPIADAALDDIRRRAAEAAPPNPDMQRLRQLLAEAEALAVGSDRGA